MILVNIDRASSIDSDKLHSVKPFSFPNATITIMKSVIVTF